MTSNITNTKGFRVPYSSFPINATIIDTMPVVSIYEATSNLSNTLFTYRESEPPPTQRDPLDLIIITEIIFNDLNNNFILDKNVYYSISNIITSFINNLKSPLSSNFLGLINQIYFIFQYQYNNLCNEKKALFYKYYLDYINAIYQLFITESGNSIYYLLIKFQYEVWLCLNNNICEDNICKYNSDEYNKIYTLLNDLFLLYNNAIITNSLHSPKFTLNAYCIMNNIVQNLQCINTCNISIPTLAEKLIKKS